MRNMANWGERTLPRMREFGLPLAAIFPHVARLG
jgi:hypothetical protein